MAQQETIINMGMCFLYEINDGRFAETKYFLVAEREFYFLSSYGKVLSSSINYPQDLKYVARVLFKDIPLNTLDIMLLNFVVIKKLIGL